ncbi:hypothetical protein SDC9_191015 [bioreactor metagenome]|uniref:Uncharacterized protein n=1 Tax=bioreactor metagenome TaxID=1076179 RepID=A0A645HWN6_9ZZZZ
MAAFRQQLSGERRVEYFRGVDAGRHEKLQLGPGIVEDFDRRRFQSLTQRRQPGGEHGEAVEGQRDIPHARRMTPIMSRRGSGPVGSSLTPITFWRYASSIRERNSS